MAPARSPGDPRAPGTQGMLGDGRADALGALTLLDDEGKPAKLSYAWREKPVVLAFLRHWG